MKRLLAALLLLCGIAWTQSFFRLEPPVPGGVLLVCPVDAAANPCPTSANIYSDKALTQPISQPIMLGPDGNFGAWTIPGQYLVQVSAPFNRTFIVNLAGPPVSTPPVQTITSIAVAPSFPNVLSFGTVTTSTTSPAEPVTISNTGNTGVVINSCSFGGTKFALANPSSCSNISLLAGATLVIQVVYSPTSAVTNNDTLTINNSALCDVLTPNCNQVSLTGTGTAAATFTLNVNCAPGTGNGTITSNETPPLINAVCTAGTISGVFSNNYATGSTPILTATSTDGGTAGVFSGGGCSTNPCTVTVTANTQVSVPFTAPVQLFNLNVAGTDQGTGTVTSDLNDVLTGTPINCTSTAGVLSGKCTGTFNPNSLVTLTEAPSGSCTGGACTFKGWGGIAGCDTTGATSTCLVTITQNQTASADFALPTTGGALTLIQKATTGTGTNSITAAWGSAQTAGDFLVCGGSWNDATTTVSSVTDTKGNTYTQASCSPKAANSLTASVWFAANIVAATAGANTTTFSLSAQPSFRKLRCIEYSGVLTSSPADGCSGATGSGSGSPSGNLTTTTASDLLVGNDTVSNSITGISSGFTQQILDSGGNDTEDQRNVAVATYNFSPTQSTGNFSTILAAFKTNQVSNTFSVNVLCAGGGNGTVSGGISVTCTNGAGNGSVSVNSGSTLSITATPGSGSAFGGYSGGGCGGSPSCTTIAITTNTTITVTFSTTGTQNYYVNVSTGNDANSGLCAVAGTPTGCTGPWRTIGHANANIVLGPGGTCNVGYASTTNVGACINVAAGTYPETLITTKNGSATQRIRYVSTTQYGAVMVGTTSSAQIWISHGTFTDIVGFDFDGSVNHNTETGVLTYAPGSAGQVNPPHNWILKNRFHDLSFGGGHSNTAGALASGGLTQTTPPPSAPVQDILDSNLLYHNNGGEAVATLVSNPDTALDLAWQDIAVNNIVIDHGGPCMQVYHSATNVIVSNNIIANCSNSGIPIGSNVGFGVSQSTFTNNIIVNTGLRTGGTGFSLLGSSGCSTTNIFSNNLMYGNAGGNWGGSCTNILANTQTGSNSTTFVNYTGTSTGDYHSKAGSTAINNGTTQCDASHTTCAPSVDFSNTSRPQGAGFDIGAYEQ